MRTTVTLDPDVEALIKTTMRERSLTFKEAVNEAIRAGARRGGDQPTDNSFPTHDMGNPIVDVTKALQLSGELEDLELAARLARGA